MTDGEHARQLAASRMYLMEEDVATIQRIVGLPALAKTPLRVVDLGAGSGTTALAVFDRRRDAHVITVDNDLANIHWAEKAVRAAYPLASWLGVEVDAANASEVLSAAIELTDTHNLVGWQNARPVDVLLHDASHERDHVLADLRAWWPLLAEEAIVWVHDYFDPPEAWGQPPSPGVREAVHQLISDGRYSTYITNGWGPVGLGAILQPR